MIKLLYNKPLFIILLYTLLNSYGQMTAEFLKSIDPKNHQFKTYAQLGHSAGDQVRERERERERVRERERERERENRYICINFFTGID